VRRIVLAALSTVSALVLLFSYGTSLNHGAPVAAGRVLGGLAAGGTSGGGVTSGAPAGSGGGGDGSFTGSVVDTRWGPVQVQIKVTGGKIVSADVLQVPQGNQRDVVINSYAVPILNQSAVSAQSAQIDTVSGATVTSMGYIQSLQSAVDAAGL
jgi:uncharacterized protein with FMN-binding domain